MNHTTICRIILSAMERKDLVSRFFGEIVSLRNTLMNAYLSIPENQRETLPIRSCHDFLSSVDHRLQVDLFLAMANFEEHPRENLELLSTLASLFDNVLDYALYRYNEANSLFTGKWTDFRYLSEKELAQKAKSLRDLMDDESNDFFSTLTALPKTWNGKSIAHLLEDRLGCIADYFVSYSGLGNERINNIVVSTIGTRMVKPYLLALKD